MTFGTGQKCTHWINTIIQVVFATISVYSWLYTNDWSNALKCDTTQKPHTLSLKAQFAFQPLNFFIAQQRREFPTVKHKYLIPGNLWTQPENWNTAGGSESHIRIFPWRLMWVYFTTGCSGIIPRTQKCGWNDNLEAVIHLSIVDPDQVPVSSDSNFAIYLNFHTTDRLKEDSSLL